MESFFCFDRYKSRHSDDEVRTFYKGVIMKFQYTYTKHYLNSCNWS